MKMRLKYKGLPMKVLAFGLLIQTLTVLSVFWVVFVLTNNAFAMSLKPDTVLTGDVITLGDLFYDPPHDAGKVLGPSPRPGSEMVLDAKTLTKVAMALNLPWRPTSGAESISLRRAATLIEESRIKSAIKDTLGQKGIPGKFDLIFASGSGDIVLPEDQPASFDITDLTFDLGKKTFKASIAAPNAAKPLVRNEISGSIDQIVGVPVLKQSLSNGAIIGARDIETVDVPGRQVNAKTLLDPASIIGMTPQRMVVAGSPIAAGDLAAPQIVQRGQTVLMIYKSGPLTLTAQGKALENGAKGDLVRVVNASTNRSLQAVAVAENEVEIKTF
jgi:flagella basal body P-ring formation protein FlgA